MESNVIRELNRKPEEVAQYSNVTRNYDVGSSPDLKNFKSLVNTNRGIPKKYTILP
jgi:hypothetical protein